MCGRFTLSTPRVVIEQRFGVDLSDLDAAPRYNIAPSQNVLTVAVGRRGERGARSMRWGLIPHWSKDGKAKGSTLNARVETLATSPTFRDSFRKRRCLIPADGFYEWQELEMDSRVRGAARKKPYWIAPDARGLFSFAGVYAAWRANDSEPWLLSCAILTAPADATLVSIHDRMPVILRPENWEAWMARDVQDVDRVRSLLASDPSTRYRAVPVSRLVNDPKNDGPDLIQGTPDDPA